MWAFCLYFLNFHRTNNICLNDHNMQNVFCYISGLFSPLSMSYVFVKLMQKPICYCYRSCLYALHIIKRITSTPQGAEGPDYVYCMYYFLIILLIFVDFRVLITVWRIFWYVSGLFNPYLHLRCFLYQCRSLYLLLQNLFLSSHQY